ncbi:MAG TPA: type II toxin-antitoxin system RelE/ParE family toxin [Tepidisphaeraceae bacterium]|nr:type II toxin-antitoxin system RelE/ParE family toxin [Tepidisphaeraceae bacterium]
MSKYVLTARARLDLRLIWLRIAEDNIDSADKVKAKLQLAMEQLADMPGMGHRRADVKNPRYRFWSVYSYLIVYYPETKPLQVVRVVHGAQNIKKLFR